MEDEAVWLRHQLQRMRTLMRFAEQPAVLAGLKELIAEGEKRLDAVLERQNRLPLPESR